jgi:hypothetical protein
MQSLLSQTRTLEVDMRHYHSILQYLYTTLLDIEEEREVHRSCVTSTTTLAVRIVTSSWRSSPGFLRDRTLLYSQTPVA